MPSPKSITSLLAILATSTLLAAATPIVALSAPPSTSIFVSPSGQNKPSCGSLKSPCQTIVYALGKARPGTTIIVQAGTYPEHLVTKTDGTPNKPITLTAAGPVTLTGDATHSRIFELRHDFYIIEGFEMTDKDTLLWLQEADNNIIRSNFFHHADGECIRAKYHSSHNLFTSNRIEDCGLTDFVNGGTGKNGEGIYLGTAPEQLDRNPTPETDSTSDNTITNNTFVTHGNECVDIKEGSERNLIAGNDCTGQRDPESGGFNSRGSNNIFRNNISHGNAGAGIRLGGDALTDGINNEVVNNSLIRNTGYALKVMRLPQGLICGNLAADNGKGFTNEATITNPPC